MQYIIQKPGPYPGDKIITLGENPLFYRGVIQIILASLKPRQGTPVAPKRKEAGNSE